MCGITRMDAEQLRAQQLSTDLMLACQHGNADIVKTLCEMGADVNAVDSKGDTALIYATSSARSKCVIALCVQPGINPNITRTIPQFQGESPLMYACWKCTPDAVEALIACGANVNAAREVGDGFTPLMYALHNTYGPVAARRIVDLLLAAGADIHAIDTDANPQAVYNHPAFEKVRTAGTGRPLNTGRTYKNRKRALAVGKHRMNNLQRRLKAVPPYGTNFVALQAKYNNHSGFKTEPLAPTNLSLVKNILGGRRKTRRRSRKTRRHK